jgi:sulfur-oxidizing protein SoxZ
MTRALINVPAKARRGEVIEIKALIQHNMETGFRYTTAGERIARDIIHTFAARYNGEEIFRAELHAALSANPFVTFHTVAAESGVIELQWTGDNGFAAREQARIVVE